MSTATTRRPRDSYNARVSGAAEDISTVEASSSTTCDPGSSGTETNDGQTVGSSTTGDHRVLMSSGAPLTRAMLEGRGLDVVAVDIGEYEKLEGCVTCLSVRLREAPA